MKMLEPPSPAEGNEEERAKGGETLPWRLIAGIVLGLIVVICAFRPLYAVDLFWHLRLGQVIGETGGIPTTDLFSAVHPDSAWVQFQWLWEWCAYLVVHLGGLLGLRLVFAIVMVGTFLRAYSVWSKSSGTAIAWALAALLLVLFGDRFRVRPDMMNLVFLMASLPLFMNLDRIRRDWAYVFLLGLLWSNFHGGGSLLLVACLGALACGASIDAWRHSDKGRIGVIFEGVPRNRWILLGVATAGVLLNPTLIPGTEHFLTIFGSATEEIPNPEWFHTYTMWGQWEPGQFHLHFALVATLPYVIGFAYLTDWILRAYKKEEGLESGELILCVGLIFLSHHWVRTAYLAIIPGYFLFSRWSRGPSGSQRMKAFAGIGCLLFVIALHYHVVRSGRGASGGISGAIEMSSYDLSPTVFPEQAANFLVDAGVEGKIFNEGKWGGYLIWRTWPACTVFFDTRHNLDDEMWSYLKAGQRHLMRPLAMDQAFLKYGTELAVFKGPVFPLYEPPRHWVLLYRAGRQEVYQHLGGEHAEENVMRVVAYYRERGFEIPEPINSHKFNQVVTAAGAQDWIHDAWRMERIKETEARLKSDDVDIRTSARRMRARRRFMAGAYEEASADLYLLLTEDSDDGRALYLLAVSRYLVGDREGATGVLARLTANPNAPTFLNGVEVSWVRGLMSRLELPGPGENE